MDKDLKFQVYCLELLGIASTTCLELLNFLLNRDIFLLVASLFYATNVKAKAYDGLIILTRFFFSDSTNFITGMKTMIGSSICNLVSSFLHWEEPLIKWLYVWNQYFDLICLKRVSAFGLRSMIRFFFFTIFSLFLNFFFLFTCIYYDRRF